jgi:ornithine lipid ester-linked acyl 2-hydroxylase
MIYILIALLILILLTAVWYKESRLFLALSHLLFFKLRHGKALHADKAVHFPGSARLEAFWSNILPELQQVLDNGNAVPKFHEVDKANHKISFPDGPAWRTLVLKAYNGWFNGNCKKFPYTCSLLSDMPEVCTVMFSILEPHVHIPAHTGKFSGVWRYHLALQMPETGNCFMEVNGEKYYWKTGEGILFNDTFLHAVTNDTDAYRIVLFLDVAKKSSRIVRALNNALMYLVRKSPIFRKALKTEVMSGH